MLELQKVNDIFTTYLVYRCTSSYDDLADLARQGGLEAVRNESNQGDWGEMD